MMCEVSEKIEKRGEKRGELRGKQRGSEEKARSTARNLFQMGMSPEQISCAVGEDISAVKNGWQQGRRRDEAHALQTVCDKDREKKGG